MKLLWQLSTNSLDKCSSASANVVASNRLRNREDESVDSVAGWVDDLVVDCLAAFFLEDGCPADFFQAADYQVGFSQEVDCPVGSFLVDFSLVDFSQEDSYPVDFFQEGSYRADFFRVGFCLVD